MVFRGRQTAVQQLEQLFASFYAMALDNQCGGGIAGNVPDALVVLTLIHFDEISTESLPRALQWQLAAAHGLQMGMVGG